MTERFATAALGVFGLHSIARKMTVLALIATLLPSVAMGWLSYVLNERTLRAKIGQELESVTSRASREIDLLIKERLYDVRVFSTSSVVAEAAEELGDASAAGDPGRTRELANYLRSVRGRFADYEELLVLDPKGRIVATTADRPGVVELPKEWDRLARADRPMVGRAGRDEKLGTEVMIIGEPIRSARDRFVGVFAAKVNFKGIGEVLRASSKDAACELSVVGRDGIALVAAAGNGGGSRRAEVEPAVAQALFSKTAPLLEYRDEDGRATVGSLEPLKQIEGGVLAQLDRRTAYAQIGRLRSITLALTFALLIVVGFAASLLGLTIVRPLGRLARGSAKVAGGDLTIDLPVLGRSEVAGLTALFNNMVLRLAHTRDELDAKNEALRAKNAELQTLSRTDSLTGLQNRHSLMGALSREVERSQRYDHAFAVLMLDVDHFKKLNDAHGHLAGDQVLRGISRLLEQSTRSCDCAARYGGDEFVVVLPETDLTTAVQVAERIRQRAGAVRPTITDDCWEVSLSIGVSMYPESALDPDTLLREADAALYEAKRSGRNQVAASVRRRGAGAPWILLEAGEQRLEDPAR
ncbi:MAG: diguanylate cyclase [Acidobacteriia bacterium]|nr:diguanylate cyclase [Terriglobia bacterium]